MLINWTIGINALILYNSFDIYTHIVRFMNIRHAPYCLLISINHTPKKDISRRTITRLIRSGAELSTWLPKNLKFFLVYI